MAFERITTDDGGMKYVFGVNHAFERSAWPEGTELTECPSWIESAVDDYAGYLDETSAIRRDQRLSDFGKQQRLEPMHGAVLESMSKLRWALDDFSAKWDRTEQELLKVPDLGGDAGQAAIDVEVRQWWRGMTQSERTNYLSELSRPDNSYGRIRLALLRSPIAVLDHELRLVREAWDTEKRALQPALAESVATARRTAEVAERAMGHLAGMAMVSTKWDADKIALHLLQSSHEPAQKGFRVFGIGAERMALIKRKAQAQKILRVA